MTYLALCQIELSTGETLNALPCPFCAAAVELSLVTDYDGTGNGEIFRMGTRVSCATCGAHGPYEEDDIGAITAWNSRFFYQDSDDAPAVLPEE